MKRLIVLSLFVVFCRLPIYGQTVETEGELISRLHAATALLYAQDAEGSLNMLCTATVFGISPGKYRLVTAAHCIAEDDTVHERVKVKPHGFFLTFDESEKKEFIKSKVVIVGYQHRGDDFAVLEIESSRSLPAIPLGDERLEAAGDPVLNIASPLGLGRQVFKGYTSLPRLDRPLIEDEINWRNAMLVQLNVGGGSSGSAIISLKQRAIIAFLVGAISEGDSPNVVAVPVSKFKDFLALSEKKEYKWFVPGVSIQE